MTIKAIIWDLGGVLVRTEDQTPREKLAADLGISLEKLYHLVFIGPTGQRAQVGEITQDELWKSLGDSLELTPEEIPAVRRRFFEGDELDLDLVNFIRSLRGRYTTALLSNAWGDLRLHLTDTWHIDDAFDELFISAELGVMKPDPRIYHITLKQLNFPPEQTVFIDDFIKNVEGARAVGMHAIHFRSPEGARSELEELLDGNLN